MNLNILQTLAADIRQFDEQVKAGTAELRARTSAVPSGSSAASHHACAEPRFYIPNPLDECTNALGHLADTWSVVRVTAQVSAAHASGLTGPSLTVQGELWNVSRSCMSIARLGSGDQTVVFPTAYATTWLPRSGVYEMKLMKRRVPNTPVDALMVHRLGVTRKGPAATPWLLDHLGMPESLEFDLHRVLASMKPVHQAVFVAAISRPDIEHKLSSSVDAANVVPEAHTLSCGIRAAMALSTLDLDRDEASLARLACLISDLGSLNSSAQPGEAGGLGDLLPAHGMDAVDTRRAHPHTAAFLAALLAHFAELEPQDAADLVGLLGEEAHRPFRIGSKDGGPFSDRPADPVLARRGCAMGDALSQARVAMNGEELGRVELALSPLVNEGVGVLERAAQGDCEGEGDGSQIEEPTRVELGLGSDHAQDARNDMSTLDSDEGEGNEEGGAGSSSLSVLPDSMVSLAPSPDALRFDLECFDEADDTPRPSLEWAAGMLDGDGCIAIVKQPYPDRNPIYRLTVSVCQNCLQTLEHFRRSVGVDGVIYAVKRKLEHNKQVYTLNYSGPRALLVIRRLRALLVRKRPEAQVAISFCLNGQISRRFGPHGVPREVEAVRVAHYLKLRALK
ncbi:MAG: hypothetical protein Q8S12_05960 [Hydrogenophaga sp.]|uniref:hypothetical protein n=1 Tax=Hydrogenophaga sp. TaxID=1904254 RepID=UPI00273597F4|nr:hypothetical protein [Hydrogenophaga sp.]MDP3626117.1 hypothetical protein [Hydrogenophaga sp.]